MSLLIPTLFPPVSLPLCVPNSLLKICHTTLWLLQLHRLSWQLEWCLWADLSCSLSTKTLTQCFRATIFTGFNVALLYQSCLVVINAGNNSSNFFIYEFGALTKDIFITVLGSYHRFSSGKRADFQPHIWSPVYSSALAWHGPNHS